ncbi:hypothetical protein F5B19DRAFT_239381 [Rostrohypoxylon terebratum]|nr:hypothetical protein F5B19DRAFT_239381 [Rostrohypoxylon terebratum]
MGHKSKFTFPMPGRTSKQAPSVATSTPLSKAEKVLGTGSPTATRETGRMWETESNGGISISISESSTSQSGAVEDDDDKLAGTNYGGTLWEEESEALPRRLRSANSPFGKGLKSKRSAATLGARSRDATTEDSTSRRPQSSSTVHSHYESAKMPLSISQQTSNSAMAKGLPSKAGALLDIDGELYGKVAVPQKKKPSKLDFSRLRLRSRKDQSRGSHAVGPVLGNDYVMRSPSLMSHMSHTLAPTNSDEKTPNTDMKITSQTAPQTMGRPGRLKGASDANTLTQLYDHYEQMSFRYAEDLQEEDEEDDVVLEKTLSNQQRLLPRTYEPEVPDVSREDMVTPLPSNSRWTHSRNTSQSSKATATRAGTPSTLQIRPASRNDYPASISSRHTRTSKATPSIMSTLDSDRQQQSVLSLTDSESDEETAYSGPGSSLPSYENSFRDDASVSSSQRQLNASRLSISSHSTNPKAASYAQLNDFLTIPEASPKTKTGRSPSTNTNYSTNSSISTATRVSIPSHLSQQERKGSVSTTGTGGSLLSPTFSIPHNYKVQEARAVTFTPLASTAEAASSVSVDRISNNLDRIIARQGRQRTSQNSHASDQPTPPLSPTSVDFQKKSSESTRKDSAAKATESHNARLMAVTRQEEMLLAALRKKRARMRENIIAEIEEDRGHRSSAAGSAVEEDIEKLASANLRDAERQAAKEAKEAREARARAKQPKSVPKRASSLMRQSRQRDHPNGSRSADMPPASSYSDPAEKGSLRLRLSPEPQTRRTGKSRHERVLLYLDRPIDSIGVIDQAEPSPDLSEFMEEELDFPLPGGRQSRTRSKLGHYEMNGRPRPDSSPVSPRTNPMRRGPPKIDPHVHEVIDAGDFDDVHYAEEVADRRKMALPPVPEKGVPRPDSPLSPGDGLLSPSVFGHKKGKKSAVVRLSAVGQTSSPIPWWGDDD